MCDVQFLDIHDILSADKAYDVPYDNIATKSKPFPNVVDGLSYEASKPSVAERHEAYGVSTSVQDSANYEEVQDSADYDVLNGWHEVYGASPSIDSYLDIAGAHDSPPFVMHAFSDQLPASTAHGNPGWILIRVGFSLALGLFRVWQMREIVTLLPHPTPQRCYPLPLIVTGHSYHTSPLPPLPHICYTSTPTGRGGRSTIGVPGRGGLEYPTP